MQKHHLCRCQPWLFTIPIRPANEWDWASCRRWLALRKPTVGYLAQESKQPLFSPVWGKEPIVGFGGCHCMTAGTIRVVSTILLYGAAGSSVCCLPFLCSLTQSWHFEATTVEMQKICVCFQDDFKTQELPLARIKKIMKLDEDVKVKLFLKMGFFPQKKAFFQCPVSPHQLWDAPSNQWAFRVK